jgi:hypothetical protein
MPGNFHLKTWNKSQGTSVGLAVGQQFYFEIYFKFSSESFQAWKFNVKFGILQRICKTLKFIGILLIYTMNFYGFWGV